MENMFLMRAHQKLELPALLARWTLPIRALRWPHAVENSLVFYTGGPSRTTRQENLSWKTCPCRISFNPSKNSRTTSVGRILTTSWVDSETIFRDERHAFLVSVESTI